MTSGASANRREHPMTRIATALKLATALAAMLTLATGTASADGGPIISAGTGCAVQCITKALVVPTSTSATVELETTVPARLTVSITKQTGATTTGGLTASVTQTDRIWAFARRPRASFAGLEPDTTYAIVVKATDLKQQIASQKGTFKTLPVKTQGLAGPTTLDSGLGCSVECIETAVFTQVKPAASIANIDLRTSTEAKIQLIVSRDKPVATAAGPSQFDVVSNQSCPGMTRSWRTQIGGLLPGTRYWAVVRAKDSQGRMSIRQGSFRTVSAHALVTLHKIKVLNDGDKRSKGELYFEYFANDVAADSGDVRTIDDGDVVDVAVYGTSRPGFIALLPANGDAKLRVSVRAQECDVPQKRNCVFESGSPSDNQTAVAGGTFDLSTILAGGALHPWYGTGVSAPAGHDGYFILSATDDYIKFLVLATVDIQIDWP
jgi:hypothetical protein